MSSQNSAEINQQVSPGDEAKTVQSVERVLNIIEALAEHGSPMNLGDLADKVGLKPSTTHRLLNTLLVRGFVDQNDDSRYKLSLAVLYRERSGTRDRYQGGCRPLHA
ncbi:MAG: helix-turn-helix domain-containing protein [Syntrophomonadales bacterium]